jgi:hypothetical protein
MFLGAGLLYTSSHLGTFAAMGFVACAGLTMMRQEERPLRAIILVLVNTPVRRGMVLKIGMEGSDLRHLLLLRSRTELPKRMSSNVTRRLLEGRNFRRRRFKEGPGQLMSAVGQRASPCVCSCTAALLPEEAFFDFRIHLVEPLLCALRAIPVRLGFSL